MAAWPFLQAREHTPHGNLAGRGPGLDSRSPESIRREHSQEEGELDLTCRTKLLERWLRQGGIRGSEGASRTLDMEREKRDDLHASGG